MYRYRYVHGELVIQIYKCINVYTEKCKFVCSEYVNAHGSADISVGNPWANVSIQLSGRTMHQ